MFLCRKANGGRFTDLFREVDKLGELVNGCIAGDAWQRRIALGRAHGNPPDNNQFMLKYRSMSF